MRILIHQEVIPSYRVPVFNEIAKHHDLTVTYTEGRIPDNIHFRTLKFKKHSIPKIGYCLGRKFRQEVNHADAVIHNISYTALELEHIRIWNKRVKTIGWGIGVPASYDIRFDDPGFSVDPYIKAINRTDASLFYADYPRKKYMKLGIAEEKLFVANNTVVIDTDEGKTEKNPRSQILFVGSLYKQKKIDILLKAYRDAYSINPEIPSLTIVGDGEERENIAQWVKDNSLEKKVTLTGAVFDEQILSQYFRRAIVCISPDQAGLSVLKSMGYGVPYVTHENAITGGEIFNIHNGKDGILMRDFSELKDIILETAANKDKFLEMGREAQSYYFSCRTLEQMVQGFLDAIDYVMKTQTAD